MTKLDLVDVGGGNIGSVKRCLERLDIEYVAADLSNPPSGDRPVLLPGVGAFGPVMDHLRKTGFDERIKSLVNSGTPFLGICVGMQILFDSSEESKGTAGLGLIKGTVRKYTEGKVPQIGWNLIELAATAAATATGSATSTAAETVAKTAAAAASNSAATTAPADSRTSTDHTKAIKYPDSGFVYFVNSFYPDPTEKSDILYSSNYHVQFCAAVQSKNITAFQFHPEKSGEFGKILLRRWVENVA